MDEMLKETVVSKDGIYKGNILDVQRWRVVLANGCEAEREIVRHRGASAILPVDDEGSCYLVKQYRTPLEKVLLEVPAGKRDSYEEDFLDCAKRELSEETGFTAESWTHLMTMATTPGFCTERIALYLARGLQAGQTNLDDDEFLSLVKMPLKEAKEMVLRGEIEDGKTALLIMLADARTGAEE